MPKKKTEKKAPIEKRVININEHNPEIEAKNKMVWTIVTVAAVALLIFWFWNLKNQTFEKSITTDQKFSDLHFDLTETFNTLKSSFNQTKELIGGTKNKIPGQQEIETVKQKVLAQIEKNLDSESWPTHQYEDLGVAVNYPPTWRQSEISQIIKISSTTSTPKMAVAITISQNSQTDNTKLENWITNFDSPYNWQIEKSDLSIDNQKTIKYKATDDINHELNWLILTTFNKKIYQISVIAPQNSELYLPIINNILSSIKFTK